MVYLIGNEAACMTNRLLIDAVSRCADLAVYSPLPEGRETRIRKTYYTIYFEYGPARKTCLCLYPETVPKNRPKFRRNLVYDEVSFLTALKYFE